MHKDSSVHTSRTIMFSELSKVMDHGGDAGSFIESMNLNITNKLSKSNLIKTNRYLKQLYGFEIDNPNFIAFRYYWEITPSLDRPVLALLYAISKDFLLSESIDIIIKSPINEKVPIERFDDNIEMHHPKRFSENTRRSAAQNIASSWKQAGYILGKVKNIRVQTNHGYHVVSFAFLLSYLSGDRGDFILSSKWVKALCLYETNLRTLIAEAAKRDLVQYQFGGSVTSISFENQLLKLGIHGK